MSSDLTVGDVATVEGQPVTVSLDPVMVNNANVINADLVASNGVIHVIDTVLIPDGVLPESYEDTSIPDEDTTEADEETAESDEDTTEDEETTEVVSETDTEVEDETPEESSSYAKATNAALLI